MEISFKYRNMMEFCKKECVLIISLSLAILSSFVCIPKLEYIDFRVLILLFSLMIIVAAFKELKVLDFIAISLLKKCTSTRKLMLTLILITFFSAMIITNDVALITFVPITIIIGKKIDINILKIIVIQTLAANLGSCLTPMGNPQNLFLYSFYNIETFEFFKITFILWILSISLLLIIVFKEKNERLTFILKPIKIKEKKKIIYYIILLAIILFSVFHIIDYRISFLITILMISILDKDLFKKVDYSLLLTFIGFFIFVGNISNMNLFRSFMNYLLISPENTFYTSIFSSQVISNVPATILLSGFTDNFKELLIGVNIGGLGTLIASLASVISYKLYCNENKEKSLDYIKIFSIYNFLGLIILIVVIGIFLKINII